MEPNQSDPKLFEIIYPERTFLLKAVLELLPRTTNSSEIGGLNPSYASQKKSKERVNTHKEEKSFKDHREVGPGDGMKPIMMKYV